MSTARTSCVGCPFQSRSRRCRLLAEGRMRELVEHPDCSLHARLPGLLEVFFARSFARFQSYADDVLQEVLTELVGAPIGTYGFDTLDDFLAWLPRLLHRRTIDQLRRAREIARPRCGACAHFSHRSGCRLFPELQVDASTNPGQLSEPCPRFRWGYGKVELAAHAEPAAPSRPVGEEEFAELLQRALEQLEARDPKGRKAVRAIRLHSLGGLTMMEAGHLLGVSHMSIKRAVDYGIRELRPILARLTGERIAC